MYTHELKEFVRIRNFRLGGDDLLKAISVEENPQLKGIKYDCFNSNYEMWDNKGEYISFNAMPYEEAQEKGLVKKL